jgi:RNA-directed DNA polymerase
MDRFYRYLRNWAKRHPHKGNMTDAEVLAQRPEADLPRRRNPEGKRRVELIRATQIHIKRHAKVRSEANPFDPEYAEYFARRRAEQQRRYMGRAALAAA